jgi:hypothetical protein
LQSGGCHLMPFQSAWLLPQYGSGRLEVFCGDLTLESLYLQWASSMTGHNTLSGVNYHLIIDTYRLLTALVVIIKYQFRIHH